MTQNRTKRPHERPSNGTEWPHSRDGVVKTAFAEALATARNNHGMSQFTAAQAAQVSIRTFRRWETGRLTPPVVFQSAILRAIRESLGRPRRAVRSEAKRHHLAWEAGRGWVTRFTVDLGAKRVGKRIRIRLRTTVLDEAKARMDLLIAGYRKLGLTIHFRIQKRKQNDQVEARRVVPPLSENG